MKTRNKKKVSPPAHSSGPDFSEVTRILEFMEQNSLEEFEYGNGAFHVRLRKAGAHAPPVFRSAPPAPEIVVAHPAAPPVPESAAPSTEAPSEAEPIPANLHVIKSPIVGTFYASPSPGTDAFVRVGDQVASGQVLCIIEAMKLMNEIEADVAGEVMRIFVDNGQPVEYGEPLFAIHPKRKQ
ncbi:MAG TPA: acetyl-CoA carboxylase biotin carboxyl carrier protein [Candidatus Acidoferrales bacterium]|nr:acetyl-CoA carboxylase biotin carboxyl carrier protein [Candidatus Acidoferrales bacterium]